jgi:THO complex subunit 6
MRFHFSFFSLDKITSCIENISSEDISEPASIFKCPDLPCSLAFHRDFLIVGSNNASVSGFEVNSSTGIIQSTASWKIQLPIAPEQFEISEVNDLWIDTENETLYAACANDVLKYSLDNGVFVQKFEGHKDFIHSVNGCDNNIVTASEDGTVKLWDNRQKKATASLEPSKNAGLVRKKLGKWVGAANISKVIEINCHSFA